MISQLLSTHSSCPRVSGTVTPVRVRSPKYWEITARLYASEDGFEADNIPGASGFRTTTTAAFDSSH